MPNAMHVFSGSSNRPLAERICEHLNIRLGSATLTRFPDGEIRVKIEDDVRGADVFIVQPTCPPVNEHVMELVLMIDAFKRASAERITAVIPYFGYARQDRKDEGRVPISAKLVANMITAAGAHRVLAVDLHAAQLQGFFDLPVDHLYASPVLTRHFRSLQIPDLTVVAPDVGSSKLARSPGGHCATSRSTRRPSFVRARWPPLRSASVRSFTSIANGARDVTNQPSSAGSSTAPRLSAFETKAVR